MLDSSKSHSLYVVLAVHKILSLKLPTCFYVFPTFLYEQISLFKDRDTLANHPKLTLELLQEVTITGFTRTDEEIDLVSLLFGRSSSIMSVTIHATEKEDTEKVSLKNIMAEDDDNDDDTTTHQQLLEIPFTDHGCWRFQGDVYSWKRYTTEDALSDSVTSGAC